MLLNIVSRWGDVWTVKSRPLARRAGHLLRAAGFGKFQRTRVKDIEVESDFTRAVKFCQEELGQAQLPFEFINLLQRFRTTDPARLKLACAILRQSGRHYADLRRVLRE